MRNEPPSSPDVRQAHTAGVKNVALKARLTVTGEQGQSLGTQKSHEFGSAGGFIGRSATCDWRLPDPTNTLSARHAEIRFTGQGFTIADLSTNGVYVNVTDAPLGRGNSALLVSGDLVYLGPYVIQVEVARVADPAPSSVPQNPLPPAPPPRAMPGLRAGPSGVGNPSGPPAGARTPLDPLAALDGEDTLQESDNPFKDLGIGKRDRDRSDFGLRDVGRPLMSPNARTIPDVDLGAKPIPAAPFAPAAPFSAPSPFPAAPAAPPPVPPFGAGDVGGARAPGIPTGAPPPQVPPSGADAAVIPPDFLDELSVLIPRLVEGAADRQANAPPPMAPPPPLPPVAAPLPSPDDPEAMVTLLRMRGRAKAPGVAAVPAFPPQAPAALTPAPQALPPQPFSPASPAPFMPAPAPAAFVSPPPLTPPPGAFGAAPVPATPTPPPPAIPAQGDETNVWSLLGLDPSRLSGAEQAQVLTDLALLVRALVGGLLELQATRRRLKAELNLDATRMAGEENPFLMAGSADDALRRLFAGQGAGHRDPTGQARAVFHELQVHELAASDAMQATIVRLMQRISPAAITFEAEGDAGNAGVFGRRADKARLWDRYLIMHERLVDALDVLSPELVGQEFARAYAHHVESMRGGERS